MPKQQNCTFIIPENILRKPERHEKRIAQILANYFNCNVIFVKTEIIKTADINIKGKIWELKSPTGNSKHTIQHQFNRANKQSKYLVIDCSRTSKRESTVKRESMRYFKESSLFKGLIIVSRKGKIILEIYK